MFFFRNFVCIIEQMKAHLTIIKRQNLYRLDIWLDNKTKEPRGIKKMFFFFACYFAAHWRSFAEKGSLFLSAFCWPNRKKKKNSRVRCPPFFFIKKTEFNFLLLHFPLLKIISSLKFFVFFCCRNLDIKFSYFVSFRRP